MAEVIREGAVRVGVDLAKNVIQVHGVDATGRVLTTKPLAQAKFIEWCVRLPQGCMVAMEAMEASSSAHHWVNFSSLSRHQLRLHVWLRTQTKYGSAMKKRKPWTTAEVPVEG